MAKLIVNFGGEVKGHYFIDQDRFTLGRQEDNDVVLDDASVSKYHAVITTIGNDQVLEDASSTNGLQVNGIKLPKHILQNNDVIGIGDFQLKYSNHRASSNMDFDKTMVLESTPWQVNEQSESSVSPVTSLSETALSSARLLIKEKLPLGGVQCVQGGCMGEKILINRPLKTFGQPGLQLIVITRRPQGYYLTHVEGKKPAKLNKKIIGDKPILLQENDLIEVIDQKLVFFITP